MIDVVTIAQSQIGVREQPGNRGTPMERYALPGEDPLPWCARFVRWCFTQAGHQLPGNPYEIASVTNLQRALAKAGAWLGRFQTPRRGDLVLFSERGQSDIGAAGRHVGIVLSADARWLVTVEGNWGDAVQRVTREIDTANIWGFARWPRPPEG